MIEEEFQVQLMKNHFHPASGYAISKVGTDLLGRFYGEAFGINCVTTRKVE